VNAYYGGIISLGALFSLLLGFSGCLRLNTFEMLASILAALLASSRIFIVLVEGIQSDNPKRCTGLMVVMVTHLFAMAYSSSMVIKSFGWELYLKIGSSKHLRVAFQNFLIFSTCMEVDVILTFFLNIAGIAFFFDGIEIVFCLIGISMNMTWSILTYVAIRREWKRFFLPPFLLGGSFVPLYLMYKIADVMALRKERFKHEDTQIPVSSLVMTAVLAIGFRSTILVYGIKCWKDMGIGLRERLDEIGVLLGGAEGFERRKTYKRDKQAGYNPQRQRALAARALSMLSADGGGGDKPRGKAWSKKSQVERSKELKELFNMFDKDGGGTIDADEMYTAMKTLGQKVSKEEVTKLVEEMDDDGSGDIGFEEFFEMMDRRLVAAEEQGQGNLNSFKEKSEEEKQADLRRLFDEFDTDGGGSVDSDEMFEAFKKMGLEVTMTEVRQSLRVAVLWCAL